MDKWRPELEDVLHFYGSRIVVGRGTWQKITCPLNDHDDKSPSASANLEAGKWNCFSCDERGDALDIIGRNEGLARFADCLRFAKENFAGRSADVCDEPGPGSELLGGARSKRGSRHFVPAWRRI